MNKDKWGHGDWLMLILGGLLIIGFPLLALLGVPVT